MMNENGAPHESQRNEPSSGPVDAGAEAGNLASGHATATDTVATLLASPEVGVEREDINGKSDGQESDNSAIDVMASDDVVRRAFRILLLRDPEASALTAFSDALRSGALDVIGMIEELVQSREFGQKAIKAPAVARQIITSIARVAWGRDPSEDELNAYAGALHAEDGLSGVFQAILGTDEAIARHPPQVVAPAGSTPGSADWPGTVDEIFNLLLFRAADESALQAFTAALAEGRSRILDVVREVVASEEFATAAIRFPTVSRHVARTVVTVMLQHEIESSLVNAYAQGLQRGYTLQAFLDEMLKSPGFLQRIHSPMVDPTDEAPVTDGRSRPPGAQPLVARGLRMGRRW